MGTSPHDVIAWLDTVGEDVATTIRNASPKHTIVPGALSTAGTRAMHVLEQLSGRSPGASLQLVHGEIIGEGGMGIVRAAEQVSLGRTVAVKTLKKRDPGAALDLLREAWVTGALEHPNVVPVHFVELDADGMPLVVLKRIEGALWADLAGNAAEVERRFGATDLLAWNLGVLMQVLNAIRYAHHRGVIHRDLKPTNVMIGDFGEVYLLDWGIAVALRDDGSGRLPLASNSELAGTPAYMAPEMLGREGSPPLSERTDIYLAGAVLFELIAGHVPHQGSDIIAVIAQIVSSQPEMPAHAPVELARICQRAMHESPEQRYPTVEAMRLALQAYLEHRGSTELDTRARARLDELLALLRTPGAAGASRDDIYRVFGACRFGFHEALAVWRDNADARAGLASATIAMAEYELADERPSAALSLLADIEAPELVARAKAAADKHAREVAALEHLRAQHDTNIGRRTRSMFTIIFGITFASLPVMNQVYGIMTTPIDYAKWSFGFVAVLVAVGYWSRHSMTATHFNRTLFGSMTLLFFVQGVLAVAGGWTGLRTTDVDLAFVALWIMTSGFLSIDLERRLAPVPIVYVIVLLVGARWPDIRQYAMGIGNGVWALISLALWRPATIRRTAEERARSKGLRAR